MYGLAYSLEDGHVKGKLHTQSEVESGILELLGIKDMETAAHSVRVGVYTEMLAEALYIAGYENHALKRQSPEELGAAALLHDVGKLAVRKKLLKRPGCLTPKERKELQQHTVRGEDILRKLEKHDRTLRFEMARELAVFHHERWDGEGYPRGIAGTQIPLGARIVAVGDVLDTLLSDRCYRRSLSFSRAVQMICQQAGAQFDPGICEIFLECRECFSPHRAGQYGGEFPNKEKWKDCVYGNSKTIKRSTDYRV